MSFLVIIEELIETFYTIKVNLHFSIRKQFTKVCCYSKLLLRLFYKFNETRLRISGMFISNYTSIYEPSSILFWELNHWKGLIS